MKSNLNNGYWILDKIWLYKVQILDDLVAISRLEESTFEKILDKQKRWETPFLSIEHRASSIEHRASSIEHLYHNYMLSGSGQ